MRRVVLALALLCAACPDFDSLVCPRGRDCVEATDAGPATDADAGGTTSDADAGTPDCRDGDAPQCVSKNIRETCEHGVWQQEGCNSTSTCVDGTCQPWVCSPNAATCLDGATRGVCSDDGLTQSNEPCGSGETCSDGTCSQVTCASQTLLCNGSCVGDVADLPCYEGSCNDPYELPAAGGTFSSSMDGAGTSHSTCSGDTSSGLMRAFHWTPDRSGNATFHLTTNFWPVQLAVHAGSCSGTQAYCDEVVTQWPTIDTTVVVTGGLSYAIEISDNNYSGNNSTPLQFTLTLTAP